jgi:hypothetical protein
MHIRTCIDEIYRWLISLINAMHWIKCQVHGLYSLYTTELCSTSFFHRWNSVTSFIQSYLCHLICIWWHLMDSVFLHCCVPEKVCYCPLEALSLHCNTWSLTYYKINTQRQPSISYSCNCYTFHCSAHHMHTTTNLYESLIFMLVFYFNCRPFCGTICSSCLLQPHGISRFCRDSNI